MRQKIYEYIEGQRQLVLELQRELTAIPALNPESGGEGEQAKARYLAEKLMALGFPAPEWINAPDPRVSSGHRPSLYVTIPGLDRSRTLWIISHLDVVPPGDLSLWRTDPFILHHDPSQDDDLIFGRGVEDNQQGIVSSILAGLACLKLGLTPTCDLGLMFVADEETNSAFGVDYILKERPELFRPDDLIMVPDFGNNEGSLMEVAEKTVLWLKFTVLGKQCHGSTPEQGVNSLVAAAALILQLDKLHERFPERNELFAPPISTFSPTKKEANVPNINTIPGSDVFYMDCRVLPCYTSLEVLAVVEGLAREIEAQYGVVINIEQDKNAQAAPPTPPESPVVRKLYRAVDAVYGITPQLQGIGGATVANFFRKENLQSVVWARLVSNPHVPNECSRISWTLGDAKVMVVMALDEDF